MLTGLDEIDWASLEHAYGPAEDVPELLRRVTSGDEDDASDALDELWGTIWHQGSVYPATVSAVPYLAEIAAAGLCTPGVLHLLGSIAESSYPRGAAEPSAVHAAVAASYDVIAPLIEAQDAATRAAAMFVLAYSGFPERVRPLIAERWQIETDPTTRAEALHAMMRVDPAIAADLADEVLSTEPSDDAELRVSAALAWIRGGRALDERVLTAALAPIPRETALSHWIEGEELFDFVVRNIAERIDVRSAIDLVVRALNETENHPAEVAQQRLFAAENLIVTYRSAIASLAEPVARFLDNADARLVRTAINLHTIIDPAMAAPVAHDCLIALARNSDDALKCLVKWNDPVVPTLLARDLAGYPRAIDAVANSGVALPFDAELLSAIRHRLTELIDTADEVPEHYLIRQQRNNEPIHLARILTTWGPAAVSAAPELIRLLAINTVSAAQALAAVKLQDPDIIAALRATAMESEQQQRPVLARLAVTKAIRMLANDSGPLLAVVLDGLQAKRDALASAAQAAADLPEHADVLVPRIREALRAVPVPPPSVHDQKARLQLAHTLWLLTGDAHQLIRALRDSLERGNRFRTAWSIADAAEMAAELGPAGRELVPALESVLENPVSCAATVQALFAMDPQRKRAGADRDRLVEQLINAMTKPSSIGVRDRAFDVLADLSPLPPASAERLRRLASGDERVFAAGPATELVRTDENTRAQVLALLSR